MSQEDVARLARHDAEWQRAGGTAETIPIEMFADDFEWDLSAYPLVDGPTRGTGRASFVDLLTRYYAAWSSYRVVVKELVDAGDVDVLSVNHETATLAESGMLVERDLFQVWTFRDGLVVRWRLFETRHQALEAAGLRE